MPSVYANMNNLFRECGNPKAHAESTCHSALYPLEAKSRRTVSNPRISKPEEFSTRTIEGLISQMILKYSPHNPLRSPCNPRLVPMGETSWQGNPPAMTSTAVRLYAPTVRTSANLGTLGQCLVRTLLAYSSISTCHAHFIPARSSPKSIPPIPENKLPKVTLLTGGDITFIAPERGNRCCGYSNVRAAPSERGCYESNDS